MIPIERTAATGTRVECWERPNARAGVVLVSEVAGIDEVLRDYATRLHAEGYAVACPDLWWRQVAPVVTTPADRQEALAALADHHAMADIGAARRVLDPLRPIFVVGFGAGGLYARMSGCALMGLAGVVEFYGRIVYPVITANHAVQPLDLLPGLACPIQCHFGAVDPVAPEAHVDELERRLATRPHAAQVFRYPGCGHAFMNPRRPTWSPEDTRVAWARALTFLEQLGDRPDAGPTPRAG